MSELEQMKALVTERLTAAVEDIFGIIEDVVNKYEEKDSRSKVEIERQSRLLEMLLKPKTTLQRADPPQLSVCKEEVPPEQQERSPSLGQEDPEPSQTKEEQQETWTSQEGEQLQWLEETDTKDSVFTITSVRSLHGQSHQSRSAHLNQTIENSEGEPLPSTSTEHMETEPDDGEGCGVPEPTDILYNVKFDLQSSGLTHHLMDARVRDRPHVCNICGKGFIQVGDMNNHKRIHTGERPYSCGLCKKNFRFKSNLTVHARIHAGERSYVCSVCGKGFSRPDSVQDHMKTHTGEKPYSCGICGKGFIQSSSVQRHMRTHTGERPYSCGVCGKGFVLSSDLQRHAKTHTGERAHRCVVCGKGFSRRDSAQDHMKTHTGERPYSCAVCGRGFRRHHHVQKHMKTHTGEGPD